MASLCIFVSECGDVPYLFAVSSALIDAPTALHLAATGGPLPIADLLLVPVTALLLVLELMLVLAHTLHTHKNMNQAMPC
jgi:hypothetical protein